MRNTRNFTKTRIVTAAALVITTMGVGTVGSAIQALAIPAIPLPISVVQQQSGHTTGVTFNNLDVTATSAAGPFGFPASVGNHITVSFAGVTKADGSPATDDAGVLGAGGYKAAFCGNYTQGRVGGDRALTGADVGSLEGITAHCGPLTLVSSTITTPAITANPTATPPVVAVPAVVALTVTNLALTVPGAVAAVAAVSDSGVHGAAAVVAGSISPAIAVGATTPAAAARPATLFTPFVAEVLPVPAIAVAAIPPLSIDAVVDTFVPGHTATPAAEGTQCVGNNTVIPCLLIVASLDQSVALALPVVNASAVSVVGRVGLYPVPGAPAPAAVTCNPSSLTAPPSTCPAARLTTSANGGLDGGAHYPIVIGGAGFAPSDNTPSLIAAMTAVAAYQAAPGAGTGAAAGAAAAAVTAGDNFTSVSEKVCNNPANEAAVAAIPAIPAVVANPSAVPPVLAAPPVPGVPAHGCLAGPAGQVGVFADSSLAGAIVISPAGGVTPGDRFLQVAGVHYVAINGAVPCATAGLTAVLAANTFGAGAPSVNICSVTQTYYAGIRILAAAPSAPVFTAGSGAPGTVGVLNGSSYEPRANVSIQRRDVNGKLVGAPITTTTDGVGGLSVTFAAGALDYPVGDVVVTTTDAAFSAPQTTQTVVVDSAGAIAFCSNSDACNVGELITVAVLPGNVQMSAGDAIVEIDAVDLSTIDITDPESWYPESAPGAITQVLIGDMRGANAGFVITGSVSDLRGATQASNIIPAVDVFMDDSVVCDVYADAGEGNDPLGSITPGAGQAPVDNQGASLLADGSQEFCSVAPDGDGRAAGMFTLDASLIVAGRPITAVDDYVGLLTLTITGN